MSFFIGDPEVHKTPFAVLAQEEAELQAEARAIRRAFAQLAREILILVINAILRALGLGAFVGPLDGAITALENALLDIPKGNIHGLVTNLGDLATSTQQIIDTILNGLGIPGAGHAVDEIFAALKVIADLIADFENALKIAGVLTPTGLIHELRGLLPAATSQFNGTTSATTVPGFSDLANGLISYTPQEGVDDVAHLIQQADGTIISAAHAAIQAAESALAAGSGNIGQAVASGQQVIDHGVAALQGVLPDQLKSLGNRAHLFGGLFSQHLTGLYNGFTGSPVTVAAAADVSAAAQQAAAAQAAAQQQLASINSQIPHFYGGTGASGNAYAAASFNGVLPSSFTSVSSTQAVYNAGTAATDQQTVSGVWTTITWDSQWRTLILRSNTAGTTYVYVKFGMFGNPANYGSQFFVELGCYVAGVNTVFSTNYYPIFSPSGYRDVGYIYLLATANGLQTFEATDYTFTFTQNTGLSISYVDGSHVSQKGASYLSAGFGGSTGGVPGSILSWDFYDSGPTQGPSTASVDTGENTVSTTYADLATTTDQVTVNIGSSGLLLVTIGGLIAPAGVNVVGYISFTLSGANTLAASDSNSIEYQAYVANSGNKCGNTFLLTGLNLGATTVKLKYKTSSGSVTVAFYYRKVIAVPL
jgi:hypothetical protein